MVGALLLLAALGWQRAEMATDTFVSYTALPGGKLDKIKPGDYLSVGYIYKVTDTTYPVDIAIINPKVILALRCNNGAGGRNLVIPAWDTSAKAPSSLNIYRDTATNDKINPDILQGAPDVDAQVFGYQGYRVVPDLCGGNSSMTLDDHSGRATFTAEVQGNKPQARVRLRFHLRDPQAKGFKPEINCADPAINPPKKPLGAPCSGPWSTEFSIYPSAFATAVPTLGPLVSVSGTVFNDLDGSGNRCPSGGIGQCDPTISGVTVKALDSDNTVVLTSASADGGIYALPFGIASLPAGPYTVHVDIPPGYTLTTANDVQIQVGSNGASGPDFGLRSIWTPTPTSTPLVLTPTPTSTPVPLLPGWSSISGTVFGDVNGDGQQCPPGGPIIQCETGVAGATVKAIDSNNNVVMTTTSDANGYSLPLGFVSPRLPQGVYTVHVDPPPGYVLTTPNDLQIQVMTGNYAASFGIQAVATPTP